MATLNKKQIKLQKAQTLVLRAEAAELFILCPEVKL